jgi:hypothetical protein
MRPFRYLPLLVALLLAAPGFAQKLVDPDKVAPEFREAAIKRRMEQIRILACQHKADVARVLPRDRAAYVNRCLDAGAAK